jgi:hypothetical protein
MRVLCARSILLLLVFCPFLKFFHSSSFRFATWRTPGRGEVFRNLRSPLTPLQLCRGPTVINAARRRTHGAGGTHDAG